MSDQEKNITNSKGVWIKDDLSTRIGLIWMIFLGALFCLFILEYFLIPFDQIMPKNASKYWRFFILAIFPLGFFMLTLSKSLVQVEESYEYVIEIFGKNLENTWKSGLHIGFPWFKVVTIRSIVYMGTRRIKLFNTNNPDDKIDFKNDSAPVDTTLLWRVNNAIKATYEATDIEAVTKDVIDGCLRSYLGKFELDDANQHKFLMDKKRILNNIDGLNSETKIPSAKESDIASYLKKRGVAIEKISINDIGLSKDSEDARRKILIEEANAKAAEHKKTNLIRIGEGEAGAINAKESAQGEGWAKQLKHCQKQGLSPAEAAHYVQTMSLHEGLTDANVFLSTGQQRFSQGLSPADGAAFGAGFQRGNKESEKSIEKKPTDSKGDKK